jgi:hypothetical protein
MKAYQVFVHSIDLSRFNSDIDILFIRDNHSNRTALDGLGKTMELTKYTERLVPSTRFVAVNGIAPRVSEMSFIAPSASVIGDVSIGKESRYVKTESSVAALFHQCI